MKVQKHYSYEASDDQLIRKAQVDIFQSEQEMWDAFREGNDQAFVTMYEQYFDLLYAYGHQFSRDTDHIKDCIQDLFIYIRKNRSRLSSVSSVKFYLYKSFRRRILHKKAGIKLQFGLLENHGDDFKLTSTPEVQMINKQLDESRHQMLNNALGRLTRRQREAIVYFYYEGFGYQQIAEIMDLKNAKSARKLIYRALDSLKGEMNILKKLLFSVMLLVNLKYAHQMVSPQ